jgi:uncharacterized protein (UPF0332 family)
LHPARDLVNGPTEAHLRAAAGRAYYAAFQEAHSALKRWGVNLPPKQNIHASVRLRFLYAGDPDAKTIGRWLDDLVNLRNEADYQLASPGRFRTEEDATLAIVKAGDLIDLLDAIEADPARRAGAIASIRI